MKRQQRPGVRCPCMGIARLKSNARCPGKPTPACPTRASRVVPPHGGQTRSGGARLKSNARCPCMRIAWLELNARCPCMGIARLKSNARCPCMGIARLKSNARCPCMGIARLKSNARCPCMGIARLEFERALSLHGDRTVEIEHTLSLHGDRLDGLNARAADLNWEIRWDQTRTDFALGAIEGMTNEIDRFQEERRKEDFQAVFEQAEPLVSVCVATADRASFLFERCIPSLLAQTYQNLQIVVVGDHCTDDTEHRFAELRDDRVTFVNLTQRGPYPPSGRERWCVAGSNAMNAALEQCKGHFITHLDDDDRYVSNRIERLVHACLEQKAEFCWHPFWAEREDGNWDMIGDGRFAVNQVNPGAVFYHRYFARFRWDPLAYQIDEPGDWN